MRKHTPRSARAKSNPIVPSNKAKRPKWKKITGPSFGQEGADGGPLTIARTLPRDAIPAIARPGMVVATHSPAGAGVIRECLDDVCIVQDETGMITAFSWIECNLIHVRPDPATARASSGSRNRPLARIGDRVSYWDAADGGAMHCTSVRTRQHTLGYELYTGLRV